MCSGCLGNSNDHLKMQQQIYATVNSLEANAEYNAAMQTHHAAINQRAQKKNKTNQQQTRTRKLYR